MLDFFNEIFQYKFLSNAVISCILSGIACGLVGSYIVCRRLVFLTGGITHSSFGGIGIAYYLGQNPIAGALVFAVLSSIGMEAITSKWKVRDDSAVGIIWSVGMAVGIIFVTMTPGYAPNLMSFLFGNILTVTKTDLLAMAALDVLVITTAILLYRPIVNIAYDRDYAVTQNLPVNFIGYLMMILISLTIVLSIRLVGIVLLISLLTMPAVIVNSVTKSFKKIALYSVFVSIFGTLSGLYLSYLTDFPSGASTIVVLTVILIVVKSTIFLIKKH
ncbi:MAG: metal ABC transporter permease [Rikenellaceae bacterium]|nr:metal ABC transporter permease [Rikenellaceae bacterium]